MRSVEGEEEENRYPAETFFLLCQVKCVRSIPRRSSPGSSSNSGISSISRDRLKLDGQLLCPITGGCHREPERETAQRVIFFSAADPNKIFLFLKNSFKSLSLSLLIELVVQG